jgi:PEGA domain-containing protein
MILIGLLSFGLLVGGGSDATLRVRTDVVGVTVLVDGQDAGETPITISPVAVGRHRITLLKAGYHDQVEDVDVQPGSTTRLFVVMKPAVVSLPSLPVEFRALHQHLRSGACIGQLTINADALDYRSDDGQDVFHLAISELRSVARSAGAIANFGTGSASAILGANMRARVPPARVETAGRSYAFWAANAENKTTNPDELDEGAAEKTKQLFEIVYKLWSTSLKR